MRPLLVTIAVLCFAASTACTSILGDFTSGPGADGGEGDATVDGGPGTPDATPADAAPDVAGDGAASCGPASCPSGCCDPAGRCVPYAMQAGSACGTGGASCSSCGAGESCSNGACSCGGTICNGCCNAAKQCVSPPTNAACGENGAQCKTCAADQECGAQGQCVCDAHTCPNGCCDASGHCVTAPGNSACGTGGEACSACGSGQECSAGKCVCDATSCPQGCCTAGGACQPFSAQSSTSCGNGGAACGSCSNGQTCSGGSCTCGGSACNGCCNGNGQCVTSSNATCGLDGTTCQACPSSQECNAQGQCVCDRNSCPNGCCDASGACVTPSTNACGTVGAACAACPSGQECNALGQCVCDAISCPSGCCAGGPTGACEPYAAQSGSSCGTAGVACGACGSGQECNKSTGQCVCDGTSCPSGCCAGSVGGTCVGYAGESTNECGSAGASCAVCTQPANGSATCAGGSCGITCNSGYTACSGKCVNLQNDQANCGACGRSCLGGQCSSATCLPYVLAQPPVTSGVVSIASDGTYLLWLDNGKNGAFQIPVAGGAVTTLASVSFAGPGSSISVASGKYAFTQTVSTPNFHVWTGTEGVANGAVQGSTTWNNGSPYGLALTPDAQSLGFVEVLGSTDAGYVYFAPTASPGGSPVDSPVCSGQGCPMKAGQQVAANGTYFAWTINVLSSINGGEVGLYNYVTHTKTFPSTNVLYPDFPLLDSSYLYWVDNASLQIWRMSLPNGTPQLVMDNGSQTFTGLAEDGTNAYFTIDGTSPGGVYAVSVTGTQSPVLIYSGGMPQQIIQAGGALFWIDSSTQRIYGLRYP